MLWWTVVYQDIPSDGLGSGGPRIISEHASALQPQSPLTVGSACTGLGGRTG